MLELRRIDQRADARSSAQLFPVVASFLLTLLLAGPGQAKIWINEAVASNVLGLEDEDEKTSDWIEIFNDGVQPVDLSGYGLSDAPGEPLKWAFPSGVGIGAGSYKIIFASGKDRLGPELHTNFKLSAAGEILTLSNASGVELDRLDTGRLLVDISAGRSPGNLQTVLFFGVPTPEQANTSVGFETFVESFEFDLASGFFTEPVAVSLVDPPQGATLHYTLDGSPPRESSPPWPGSLVLADEVNVLRVRAFEPGKWPSAITTGSYLINPDPTLPVLSLVLDPRDLDELWDRAFAENEVPMHVDLFERDGSLAFSVDIGAELFGFGSRLNAQKSFQLKPRGGYADPEIRYQIFPDRETDEFHRLILRNSGNDWLITQLRDGLAQGLVDEPLFATLGYRPAVTYVNGEYWGMYNMREHHDPFYTETYYGEEEIDMLGNGFLQSNAEEIEGDSEHYDAMIEFMDENDLGLAENYGYIQTQMDTEQFAAYEIAQIFFANTDWPHNNIKYWRPKRDGGRWRWMLFDTDFGLGMGSGPDHDTLDRALGTGWSTKVLTNLVESPIFQRDFINRYADYLNTRFQHSVTRPQLVDKALNILPEIGPHMMRWGGDPAEWFGELRQVDDFLRQRSLFARQHVIDTFDLDGTFVLTLDAQPEGSGQIELTAITPELPFQGIYFLGNAVNLTAVPAAGFVFSGWSDPDLPQTPELRIAAEADTSLSALFLPGAAPDVVVHEINYNSADSFDPGDWVELHNPGASALDLTGWSLKDDQDLQVFDFPAGTTLPAGGYLVVCQNLAQFEGLFTQVPGALGDLGFGLGGSGDQVRVFDAQGTLRDLVAFDDMAPWPTEPDGNGPTLELTDPTLNNNDGTSWAASTAAHGSPGTANGG